jgi:hypothetical protein
MLSRALFNIIAAPVAAFVVALLAVGATKTVIELMND